MVDGVIGERAQNPVIPENNIAPVQILLLNMGAQTVKGIIHRTATPNIALLIVYGVVLVPV